MVLTMTMLPTIAFLWDWILPEPASTNAAEQDALMSFIMSVTAFFFVLNIALMVIFAVRYRRKKADQRPTGKATHSTLLEVGWSLPPLIIVMIIFWFGMTGYTSISAPGGSGMQIDVRAWTWNWEFKYELPEGNVYRGPELHVPVDTPIELTMRSDDVIHSLFIPAFRVKKDAVPGRFNKVWFEADKPGTYPIFCTEYCGTGHSSMVTRIVVHETRGDFEQWLANAARAVWAELPDDLYEQWKAVGSEEAFDEFVAKVKEQRPTLAEKAEDLKPPFVVGEELYKQRGCAECHSLDGSAGKGPTWKGLWQKRRVFRDGTEAIADAEYLREAILYPEEKIVVGNNAIMPEYPGRPTDTRTEREVDAIIAFIKKLDE
jgi:cytochrome c oxidase subunit 2